MDLVDSVGRNVNRSGYLIDNDGNVISKYGEFVLARSELDPLTDDIPALLFAKLFREPNVKQSRSFKKNRRRRASTGK